MNNGSIAQRYESVPIADITIPKGRRHVDQEKVKSLARSVSRIGLLHPVVISKDYRLVCGEHRIEAYKLLKLATIDCVIVDADALLLELAEIDENVDRNDLTAQEKQLAVKRRKEIYEALNGLIVRGGSRKNTEKTSTESTCHSGNLIGSEAEFVADTAAVLGVSERTVRRDVATAEAIAAEVHEKIAGTPIADSKKELAALAKLSEAQQKKVADKIASGKAKTVAEATPKPRNDAEEGGAEPHEALKPLNKMDGFLTKMVEQLSAAEGILGKDRLAGVHAGMDATFRALTKVRTSLRKG